MVSQPLSRNTPARRGFTLIELLVALAAIILLMVILTQGFGAAAESFRELKAIGDQAERLRATAQVLRENLAETHFDAQRRIGESLLTGSVDREEFAKLRAQYQALAADVENFDAQLAEVEAKLVNPADKRIIRRARGYLDRLGITLTGAIELLILIEKDDDDDK